MKHSFMAILVAAAGLLTTSCHNSTPKGAFKTDIDTLSYEVGMVLSPGEELPGYLEQAGSDSASVEEFIKGFMQGLKAGDDKKKMAYYIGIMQGLQSKQQMPQLEAQIFNNDSTKRISLKNFVSGYVSLIKGKTGLKVDGKLVDKELANKRIMEYMFTKQKDESAKFMAAKAKEEGVKELADGVLYKVVDTKGGTDFCAPGDSVVVKYEGKLPNGSVFDTSAHRQGGVATLSLNNVIEGWKIALPKMPIGDTWEIYIPYNLAYGEQGTGPIPPYSALTFTITLVEVAK